MAHAAARRPFTGALMNASRGVPVPSTPFPKLNDTAQLRMVATVLRTLAVVLPLGQEQEFPL